MNYSNKGGNSLVSTRPIYSDDGKFLFCSSGFDINVFSIASEECCISLKGHRSRVTSIIINPLNKLQIFSSCLDSEIIKWDFSDNVILKRFKIQCTKIWHLYATTKTHNSVYAVVDMPDGTNFVKLALDKLPTDELIEPKVIIQSVNSDNNCQDLGTYGSVFSFINKRNLHVYHLKKKLLLRHNVPKLLSLTCIRCHPTQYCIATGLSDGKIYIWHDIFPEVGKAPVKTIIHWHALPLRCLAFTPEGSYLLSGGYECVLVKWQLETYKRDTLPRLGAPLIDISISGDGNLYAVSHIDNGIQIISNTFNVVQSFQGLVKCHKDLQVKSICPKQLLFDPRTEALVLNGGPGQLQFYNWKKNVQLFRLDVVGENYISPENLCNPLNLTEVLLANFDLNGDWLATVEGRQQKCQSQLKFWNYDDLTKTFNLNTCINVPHDGEMSVLIFKRAYHSYTSEEKTNLCVTASSDNTFKVWRLIDTSDIYKSSVGWRLGSTGSFKNLAPTAADFSSDGSIMAFGFQTVFTVWNPEETILLHSESMDIGIIRKINFEKHKNSYNVFISRDDYLAVYNTLYNNVTWIIALKVVAMATHPSTNEMAVFTDDNSLMFFKANDSKHLSLFSNMSESKIISALYIDKHLLYFNEEQDLLEFENQQSIKFDSNNTTEKLIMVNQSETAITWNNILGNKRITEGKVDLGKTVQSINTEKYNKILEMPIYAMPPIENLCLTYLETYMKKKDDLKTEHTKMNVPDEGTDDDDDDEDDDDDDSDNDKINDKDTFKNSLMDIT